MEDVMIVYFIETAFNGEHRNIAHWPGFELSGN